MQAGTLLAAYRRDLAERGFQEDPAQLAVLARLEALALRLGSDDTLPGNWRRGIAQRFPRLAARLPGAAPERAARGLYIWGSVGRGKTYLMDLFYAHLPTAQKRRRHFHRFMREAHAELARLRGRADPLQALARRLARDVRVLCFDELYVSDIGDAMILHGLLTGLLERGVTLVVTSNLPPSQLYRGGLQRERFLPAIALLERDLEVLELGGAEDHRLRRLEQLPIYVDSAAPDAAQRLGTLFDALAGASDPAGRSAERRTGGALRVEGRPIPTVRQDHEIAWFSFQALCEGPRSQNDYVELAQMLHTLLVSGVPVFSDPAQDDAARRFIALVDELYDRNVKLALSAAAPPAQLYRNERLAFEFQRTASRLIEMQSREYLARPHKA